MYPAPSSVLNLKEKGLNELPAEYDYSYYYGLALSERLHTSTVPAEYSVQIQSRAILHTDLEVRKS